MFLSLNVFINAICSELLPLLHKITGESLWSQEPTNRDNFYRESVLLVNESIPISTSEVENTQNWLIISINGRQVLQEASSQYRTSSTLSEMHLQISQTASTNRPLMHCQHIYKEFEHRCVQPNSPQNTVTNESPLPKYVEL